MDRSYDFHGRATSRVVVGAGVEARLPQLLRQLEPDGIVVAFDPSVAELAERMQRATGARVSLPIEIEPAKQLTSVGALADQLQAAGTTRNTAMVAIGGGTVTDLCGFVASIYLRGIPFVACATTTLAMCDAALGGKNGVDHGGLKNRLGTIRQPHIIAADTDWLADLPDEHFREGLVEAIKKAAVLNATNFARFEQQATKLQSRDPEATQAAIEMAVEMKMAVVLADEHESDRRRALNFGHTIGHAIESLANGELRHGLAVAMGIVAECRAADVDSATTARIDRLLNAIGVATDVPRPLRRCDELWQLARQDKKALRGDTPMYVPDRLGTGRIVSLTPAMLERALQ